MLPEEIAPHIERLKKRSAELEEKLADTAIYSKPFELKSISREHQKLGNLFRDYEKWRSSLSSIEENRKMLQTETDEELKSLISADIESLAGTIDELERKVRMSLLPPDENEARNIIIEIRPAAGGNEAGLFAGELYRMYTRYAETRGWKQEVLDLSDGTLGGIKEVVFSFSGEDVFPRMRYESGVHRVQRIPATESGGRIHTSTVTVAVMPEAEDVEIEVRNEDLRFDVYRSSGPGGQCVNTTDSAVRVTHIPTGLSVASQQEKSQHRNKEIALRILRARLFEMKQREEAAKQAASKRAQIGTGDRSERIRTYNFPQNRITDHRFGINIYNLPKLMEGNLDDLIDSIISAVSENKLAELLNK